MKALSLAVALSLFAGTVAADQYVRGYVRKDGTYVQPHYRTTPNNNRYDNYSTQGSSNPYTGQRGYVDPQKNYDAWRNYNNTPYGGR